MSEIGQDLSRYLRDLLGGEIIVTSLSILGASVDTHRSLKEYGYGAPIRVDFKNNDKSMSCVVSTVKPGGFGHDTMADRAAILLWQHEAFNQLPKHVRSVDVGVFTKTGIMRSVKDSEEFFIVTDFVEGEPYYTDLDRVRDRGKIVDLDKQRSKILASYLSEIHSEKKDDPQFYRRRVRELIGDSECIMGMTDSFPSEYEFIKKEQLMDIEKRCVEWKWRISWRTHRLSCVHGDFHPMGNILFRDGTDFTVLDRSRGSWGEPADDVASLTINYIFYALQQEGGLRGPFRDLFYSFWNTYLKESHDKEVLNVIAPYYTFRALVIANPLWYPNLKPDIRRMLLNFAVNVLEHQEFDPGDVNPLLGDPY